MKMILAAVIGAVLILLMAAVVALETAGRGICQRIICRAGVYGYALQNRGGAY